MYYVGQPSLDPAAGLRIGLETTFRDGRTFIFQSLECFNTITLASLCLVQTFVDLMTILLRKCVKDGGNSVPSTRFRETTTPSSTKTKIQAILVQL